ncbi:hypothetical protein A5893_17225 [Pedobacter psychrophilus]|uniref:Uncharacterized protein n=1 Tax=Pedobacter psychrophilus TaxID=1826909 RepID=A0A179DRM2_9SPHI|nr:hypothetical protein [Pedobacter psychrophilus]OAQ43502.1 hypothetical protein A5893_17225 [Pedobacter psychrophilus]
MKKVLGIIIGIVVILWIAMRIFGGYNSNNILSNEACFEIFIDSDSFNVDKYFDLPEGTFDKDKDILICKLPVEVQGFKASHVIVRTDLKDIDCNAKFKKGDYIQYEPYELKGSDFELLIVKKNANLVVLNTPIGQTLILAKKNLSYDYSKGKVNRLVVCVSGLSEYCK